MNQRLVASLLCALVWVTPSATVAQSNSCPFNGPYVGAAIGGLFTNGSQVETNNATFILPDTNFPFTQTARHGQRKDTLTGSLFLGYGYTCQGYYLGLEAFINRTDYNVTTTRTSSVPITPAAGVAPGEFITLSSTSNIQTKLRGAEFGIDLRPGILLTENSLLFGKVGVSQNRLSLRHNTFSSMSFFLGGPTGGSASVNNIFQTRKSIAALRLGFGLEQQICPNLSLRIDYAHTRYGKITVSGPVLTQAVPGIAGSTLMLSETVNVKLRSNAVTLGLSYNW